MASSSVRVLSDVPDPSSTKRVGPGGLGDRRGLGVQDRALGFGRVVLGQSGDRIEELAAAVVVEPLGREFLGRRDQTPRDVVAQRTLDVVGAEQNVDFDGHKASCRTPSAVTITIDRSGTGVHGPSSSGSEVTTAASSSRSVQRVLPPRGRRWCRPPRTRRCSARRTAHPRRRRRAPLRPARRRRRVD